MMPKPKFTSWMMDELLQPFVHYIPLKDDLSNVEEMVDWVQEHDKEAQAIAHRSSLWLQDLLQHPEAETDDRIIQAAILKRYMRHFVPARS